MKRRIISLIMVLGLICLSSFNVGFVDGTYGVTVGEIYNYELILARQNLTYGDHYASCKGLCNWGYQLNEGAILTYEITNVNDLFAGFNLTSGSFHMSMMTMANFDLTLILQMSLHSIFLAMSYNLDPWNQTIWEKGFHIPYLSPFLETSNDTWDELKNLDQYMTNICDDVSGTNTITQSFSEFQTNEFLEIETYINGDILGSLWGDNAEISINNQLKFVFNTETGVLQGLHIKAWLIGDYADYEDLEISYEYFIELVDYDLQDFLFSDVNIVGSFGELMILGMVAFTIIIILAKYQKKKRS